jgi:sugar O-acyltransferase (sialic acid O-acetyltransferase NeuD family)
VKAVVNNIRPTEAQRANLDRRLSLAGYEVPVVELDDFRPASGEKYCYGFFKGRRRLIESVKATYGIRFPPLVHSSAYLGSNVFVGEGVIIGPHAVIAPNCKLGDFSLINRALSIGHDTELGEYCTIAPGASIAGMVRIGTGTTVGIGATIIDGIAVGQGSFVGAGAVVVKDVPDGVVVAGVPARVLRTNDGE